MESPLFSCHFWPESEVNDLPGAYLKEPPGWWMNAFSFIHTYEGQVPRHGGFDRLGFCIQGLSEMVNWLTLDSNSKSRRSDESFDSANRLRAIRLMGSAHKLDLGRQAVTQPPSISQNGMVRLFGTTGLVQPGEWISIYGDNLASGLNKHIIAGPPNSL